MPGNTLSVAEIEQRYPNEWVLIEVTREHSRHERIQGRVLAHGPDRDKFTAAYQRFRSQHPDGQTYQFFTGEIVAPGWTVVL